MKVSKPALALCYSCMVDDELLVTGVRGFAKSKDKTIYHGKGNGLSHILSGRSAQKFI